MCLRDMLAPLQQEYRLFLAISRDLFNSLQRNEAMPDLNNFMKEYALFHNSDQLVLKSSVHFCCPENKYKERSAYQSIRICLICSWSIHAMGKSGGKTTVIGLVVDVICWSWLLVQVNSSPRAADSSINAVLSLVKGVFWYCSQEFLELIYQRRTCHVWIAMIFAYNVSLFPKRVICPSSKNVTCQGQQCVLESLLTFSWKIAEISAPYSSILWCWGKIWIQLLQIV